MKTKIRWPVRTTLALSIATTVPHWVQAQTLEPVVISASRAEQRSMDVPAPIESLGRHTNFN
ncbi:MAG: hypothetical protein WCH44_08350, partial [Betaproteobacteria bacterium]